LRRRQSEAEAALRRTRHRLTTTDIVLEAVEEAAALTAVTKAEFEVIGQQAAQLAVAQRVGRRQQLTNEIRVLATTAREELAASDYLEPFPATVDRRRVAVEQALLRASAVDDTTLGEGELEMIRADLAASVENLRHATTPPPAVLVSAADAFLSGDYAGVLARLRDPRLPSDRAASYAHLLRAAALFSLYHAGGQGDSQLLERAGQEVVACRRADAIQRPSAAVFSPSFVDFFAARAPADELRVDDSAVEEGR
jgi:hypothetical protein